MGIRAAMSTNGLEIMSQETRILEGRVLEACGQAANEAYGVASPKGLSVYLYGSPGRGEMVGGDGDADIFILEERRTPQSRQFRKHFSSILEGFDYAKLDLPEWGTLAEAQSFVDRSLVEGNQVLETRFIWGDEVLNSELSRQKKSHNSVERAIKNFVFNRLYLDEYFTKKIRDGALNIKYCPGGSRDLLFLSWYQDVINLSQGIETGNLKGPRCLEGARLGLTRRVITFEDYSSFVDSVDYMTRLRTAILGINKTTPERGLSFLDSETLARLEKEGFATEDKVVYGFEQSRKQIRRVVERVGEDVLYVGEHMKGPSWRREMNIVQNSESSEEDILGINSDDSIVVMGQLWNANSRGLGCCFEKLVQRHRTTEDWAVLGTILNSSLCPSDVLHDCGTGIGKQLGYGYLLRVIARNPNTSRKTLKSIVEDPSLESRYTAIAQAALEGGIESTKNQL